MTPEEYMKAAVRLDITKQPVGTGVVGRRFAEGDVVRIAHHILGIGTESGELTDALKRWLIYGEPIDRTNIEEEIGDLLWYCAGLIDTIGSSFETVMVMNLRKLQARYPDGFTEANALNRDLEAEREALEELDRKVSK